MSLFKPFFKGGANKCHSRRIPSCEWHRGLSGRSRHTCLLGHIRKSPVSVILEQEVFPILVIAEHVRPPLVQDRSNDHATAPCTASTRRVLASHIWHHTSKPVRPVSLLTPAFAATSDRATMPWLTLLAASSISRSTWRPIFPLA